MPPEERHKRRPVCDVATGFSHIDDTLPHVGDERIGERHHPMSPAAFDRHGQLRRPSLRNGSGDRGCVQQELACRDSASASRRQQNLRDHSAQIVGQSQLRVW